MKRHRSRFAVEDPAFSLVTQIHRPGGPEYSPSQMYLYERQRTPICALSHTARHECVSDIYSIARRRPYIYGLIWRFIAALFCHVLRRHSRSADGLPRHASRDRLRESGRGRRLQSNYPRPVSGGRAVDQNLRLTDVVWASGTCGPLRSECADWAWIRSRQAAGLGIAPGSHVA
jgi:hypothetical protein